MRPLTNAIPKEMLPVGGRLALERITDELSAAGILDVVFVLSPAKEAFIRGYFGDGANGVSYHYALQNEMRGLGHAILQAEPFLSPDRPFVVALGDAVFEEPEVGGLTRRLCEACAEREAHLGLAVQRVPRERISRYGVIKPLSSPVKTPDSVTGTVIPITDIIEKPAPEEAPSEFAAAARYVAHPQVFEILRRIPPGKGGEIQFTDAMRDQLAQGLPGIAVPLLPGEVRHDIGNLETYYRAFVAFALKDPENGATLNEYLRTKLQES
ncbi:MAG: UTP--glucose-1-phosphate uridylyltransferase GalU [Armatimonadaceae bacterium]